MAETITMPKLGFDMQEGTLIRWVKVEGESVEKGQVLAEIETDKATVEVESSASGIIHRHLVEQGSIVPVGTPIVVIAAPGEKVDDAAMTAGAEAAMPEAVKEETQPAEKTASPGAAGPEMAGGRVKASPLAKKVAGEHGIDLANIKGSGPGGRVVRKDIETILASPKAAPVAAPLVIPAAAPTAPAGAPAAKPAPVATPMPVWTGTATVPADEHIPVDKLRAIIGRRMAESKQQVPHFYVTHLYNVEPLLALRSQINEMLPDEQKLTVNDFIVKAVALNLRLFPNLNASLVGNEVIRHGHVNIGVAVAVENGLLTIVSKDADQKPIRYISGEVREMAGRARLGKVRPDDIEGSTFSISNMGMYDVENFFAIINPPEAAILAVGTAQKIPVVDGDQVKVGTRMKATISADHRITDGAEAARFMQSLAGFIEKPLRLMI